MISLNQFKSAIRKKSEPEALLKVLARKLTLNGFVGKQWLW